MLRNENLFLFICCLDYIVVRVTSPPQNHILKGNYSGMEQLTKTLWMGNIEAYMDEGFVVVCLIIIF